jgi:hypothetical protein
MKKHISFIGVAAFMLLLVSSCGKYENGPKVSFIPKIDRITGTWQPEKIFTDGVENETALALISTLELTLEREGYGYISLWMFSSDVEWKFENNKEDFAIRTFGTEWSQWYSSQILRLSSTEFWIKETNPEDSTVTETHYKKL